MHPRHWWKVMLFVLISGIAGVLYIGVGTYRHAPPLPDFVDAGGQSVFTQRQVLDGQAVFQKHALMEHGSMFGDGGGRGPDYTADALHQIGVLMAGVYRRAGGAGADEDAVMSRVRRELKENHFDAATNRVTLNPAQAAAFRGLVDHYRAYFGGEGGHSFSPAHYISGEREVESLAAFFAWGAWVCAAQRPGEEYSYTHNWPFDPAMGNTPTSEVVLWSVYGCLGLMAALGGVLYLHGRFDKLVGWHSSDQMDPVATPARVASFAPTPTQRASYKFFGVAMILFIVQVLGGVLTVHDFVGFTRFFGIDLAESLPLPIVRSWHLQLSLFWIAACWIGASIFVLPLMSRHEPRGQLALVNTLFWALVVLVAGSVVGIFMGPKGLLGDQWNLLGHQGWEFVELGKLWQAVLLVGFVLWAVIVARGIAPLLKNRDWWSLPYWLLYTTAAISVLFLSGFVAGPETNFAIADFWRWCVIHMWVEAFFEVFTTVVVAYFMVLMGLISQPVAVRVVFLSTLLFLGSGILGISHNFYWNAKPVAAVALGSVFSTLQVVPLILLTLEAWKFRRMPQEATAAASNGHGSPPRFAMSGCFLFLIGVNFWNFVGAGIFGFIINLPIINYFEHGTYFTVNHGHAALMGVYGNLSIAGVLFCLQYLVVPERWNERLVRCVFWSLNLGLALMVALDLFPAGGLQLGDALRQGLWHARSQEFIQGDAFQTLTWMRAIGGPLFVVGGVCPLLWYVLSRWGNLKRAASNAAEARRMHDGSLAALATGQASSMEG